MYLSGEALPSRAASWPLPSEGATDALRRDSPGSTVMDALRPTTAIDTAAAEPALLAAVYTPIEAFRSSFSICPFLSSTYLACSLSTASSNSPSASMIHSWS